MAYKAPDGPPPSYPQQPPQAHWDAGPAGGDPRAQQGYYGSPGPNQYGSPQPYGQGPYGPPQGGPYGPGPQGPYNQQPMMYQQQPGYGPQAGYYGANRRGGGAGEGILAGLCGALACCCCLDCLF